MMPIALMGSVFWDAIDYFIFKDFPGRIIYFSWKNIENERS